MLKDRSFQCMPLPIHLLSKLNALHNPEREEFIICIYLKFEFKSIISTPSSCFHFWVLSPVNLAAAINENTKA